MALINPISHHETIVTDPNEFIGRKKEIACIQRYLLEKEIPQNLAIIAEKGVGGSSLIYQAISKIKEVFLKQRIVTVSIDLGATDSAKSLFLELIKKLHHNIEEFESTGFTKSSLNELYQTIPDSQSSTLNEVCDFLKSYLKQLGLLNIKAVCTLDEFDHAKTLFKENRHLFQLLRELGTEPEIPISFVIIAYKEISFIEQPQTDSSELNEIFAETIHLQPFDDEELSEYYSRLTTLPLKPEDIQTINNHCKGWPYLMNLLCHEVFEVYRKTKTIKVNSAYETVKKTFDAHKKAQKAKENSLFIQRVLTKSPASTEKDPTDDLMRANFREREGSFKNYGLNYDWDSLLEVKENDLKFGFEKPSLLQKELFLSSAITPTELQNFFQLYQQLKSKMMEVAQWMSADYLVEKKQLSSENLDDPSFMTIALHLGITEEEFREELKQIVHLQTDAKQEQSGNKKSGKKIDPDEIKHCEKICKELLEKIETLLKKRERFLLKQKSLYEEKGALPIALKKVVIRNYYDLSEMELELSENAQWIFLTGENGFGKTLLLRAIVIALHGNWVKGWGDGNIAPDAFNAGVELLDDHSVRLQNFNNPFFTSFTKFAAYGPSRLSVQELEVESKPSGKSDRTYSLFKNDGLLLNIERRLVDLHILSIETGPKQEKATQQLAVFKETLLKLLSPYIVEIDTTGAKVSYREKGGTDKRSFDMLASGVQSIIAMAGDILIRLMPENQDVQKTADLKGIVIIDEIDLHLHPKWQKELPIRLTKLFPNVQFIASTHSPIPLLGAPPNSVFLRVRKNEQNQIEVDRLEVPDITRFQPNIILSSPIFDMDEIFHFKQDNISEVRTEDSWKTMKQNKETKAFLMKKFHERKQRFQRDSKK